MGEINSSPLPIFYKEQDSIFRFRRALRRGDQIALDDLFAAAGIYKVPEQDAEQSPPFEIFLLCILLEEHKEVMRLRKMMAELDSEEETVDLE